MSQIGRNDPCPCGSGKKYKQCHGNALLDSPEGAYERVRRLDGQATELLMKYQTTVIHRKTAEDPWAWYKLSKDVPRRLGESEQDPFIRWMLFSWRPGGKKTVAEQFLADRRGPLDEQLGRFIEATTHTPYSFYQMVEVEPGASALCRDLLRSGDVRVAERTATRILLPGHIILARVVEFEGVTLFMGLYDQPLSAPHVQGVLALRNDLHKIATKRGEQEITAHQLLEDEDILRGFYFRMVEAQSHEKIDLRNTDGDVLAFHTLTYEIPSMEEAFERLKGMEQRVSGDDDEMILAEAERTKGGALKEIVIHWLRKGSVMGGGPTSLAALRIRRSRLVVEVNSERRAKKVRQEIAKRLGTSAVLLTTEIMTREEMMRKAGSDRTVSGSERDTIDESPEVRAQIRQMLEQHWATWPDTPLPALEGKTPRQAAKDRRARELLESLLLEFEGKNLTKPDELNRVDVEALRKTLGMVRTKPGNL